VTQKYPADNVWGNSSTVCSFTITEKSARSQNLSERQLLNGRNFHNISLTCYRSSNYVCEYRHTTPRQRRHEVVRSVQSANTASDASFHCRGRSGTAKRRRTASRRSRGRHWDSGTRTTLTRHHAKRKTSPNSPDLRRLRSATGSRTDASEIALPRERTAGIDMSSCRIVYLKLERLRCHVITLTGWPFACLTDALAAPSLQASRYMSGVSGCSICAIASPVMLEGRMRVEKGQGYSHSTFSLWIVYVSIWLFVV